MVTNVKCYIKDEDSMLKNVRDVKQYVPNVEGSHQHRKSIYTSPIKGKNVFKRVGKVEESFTPQNTRREQI